MNEKSEIMIYRNCPLCQNNNFKIKYKRNYNLKELQENLFSARRERKKSTYEHNTFLKCKNCGLIYANPIIKPEILEKLYKKSKFNYGDQEKNLKRSYGRCLKKAEKYVTKERILDIGTGNGFFLLEALKQGYEEVYGIEPSEHAVELADDKIKKNIIKDILRGNQFKSDFFDVICLFQVIDHIENPNEVLRICNKYLKEGGIIICVSHDVNSLSAKILGEKSPIFDIEHTQLFSKKTISKIIKNNGFKVLEIFNMSNTYTLEYWITATPIPISIKKIFKLFLEKINLTSKEITIKPGNFCLIARKIRGDS